MKRHCQCRKATPALKQLTLRILVPWWVFCLVVMLCPIGGQAGATTFMMEEHQVTATSLYESSPRLGNDGVSDLVTYSSLEVNQDGQAGKGDIWYQRLVNGKPYGSPVVITSPRMPNDNQWNDVSGDYIVYTSYNNVESWTGQIMLYQISTDILNAIPSSGTILNEPRIQGDWIVWREGAFETPCVMLYNLQWMRCGCHDPIRIAGPIPAGYYVDIGSNYVVWIKLTPSGQRDVVTYDLNNGISEQITNTPSTIEWE